MKKLRIKTEKDVLDEILAGKYQERYLIYCRKSTDEMDSQKNSIDYQKKENTKFAHKELCGIASLTIKGFCVDGVIAESHSGYTEDNNINFTDSGLVQYRIARPKFQKMLQFISQGLFKGIICLSWDRISRNKGDDTLIRKLMAKGIDFRFAYAKYDETSAGALHMDIDSMVSGHHSRITGEKVSIVIKNSRNMGLCTYRAPIGYQNNGSMDDKPLDPERAPLIKQIYELYATGEWSLSDLARFAKEQGLMTVPMRRRKTQEEKLFEEDEKVDIPKISRPLNENHISRILTNPFYTGKVLDNDKRFVQSNSHEAIVTDELFNRVQILLKKKTVSTHYAEKLELPLRGIARCEGCNRVYTPYEQKGIQYFSSRCRDGCTNSLKNFNLPYIEDEIGKLISKLYFSDEEIEQMDSRLGTDIALLEMKRQKELDQIERKKKKTREELAYIRSNKLVLLKSGVYTPEGLVEEDTRLNSELSVLQNQEQCSDTAMHETMKDVFKLSELLKNLVPYYDFAKSYEKEKIIRTIFSELFFTENTLNYKLKQGFECFDDRFKAIGDPTAWLSELLNMREGIRSLTQDLDLVVQ